MIIENIQITFFGFSAGIITPLRIGEYFGRGIEFKDKSIVQVTVATLIDKFFPLLMVASLGSFRVCFYLFLLQCVHLYSFITFHSDLYIFLFANYSAA
ncbi:MAG: hypothetical protein IPM14_14110 [bacterium]|nr:hypothetical protein [bacterium]